MGRLISIVLVVFLVIGGLDIFFVKDKIEVFSQNKQEELILVKNGAGEGRDIYVPASPKRVVILNPSSLMIWLKLNGAESLLGAPVFPSVEKSVYESLGANFVNLGQYASVGAESLLLLKPDLVIANGVEALQNTLGEELKKAGIPLLTLPCKRLVDNYTEIELLGRLTGSENQAQKEIERIKYNIEKERNLVKDEKPKKVLLVFGLLTSFSMILPGTRQDDILLLAGGENIVSDVESLGGSEFAPISLEYVAQKDPDYVFFLNHGLREKMKIKMQETLAENSAWHTIRAVREGRVYILPPEIYAINPGLKSDYAVSYIRQILHPEIQLKK